MTTPGRAPVLRQATVVPLATPLASRSTRSSTTVVRHLHLPSVAKVAVLLWAWFGLMVALAVAAGWWALTSTGNVGRFETLMRDLGFNDFSVDGDAVLRVCGVAVAVAVVGGVLATCLMAAMFNLITRAVGGVKVGVDEADRRIGRAERRQARRAAADGSVPTTRHAAARAPRSWTGRGSDVGSAAAKARSARGRPPGPH